MENLINFDDSDLLSLLKEGNMEAFNTLFKTLLSRLEIIGPEKARI